jgi:hypothetical protein
MAPTLATALSLLACQINLGGPERPGDPIPASEQAAQQMDDAWQSALSVAAGTGSLTVILNEAQVTSFLTRRFEAHEDPVLREPQVLLRDGVIQIYGITQQGILQASVLITVAPRLEPEGDVSFEVTSADFGPFPVPDAVRQTISATVTEAFTSPIGSLATGIRVSTIAIADGEIAIVGQIR